MVSAIAEPRFPFRSPTTYYTNTRYYYSTNFSQQVSGSENDLAAEIVSVGLSSKKAYYAFLLDYATINLGDWQVIKT